MAHGVGGVRPCPYAPLLRGRRCLNALLCPVSPATNASCFDWGRLWDQCAPAGDGRRLVRLLPLSLLPELGKFGGRVCALEGHQ